MYYIAVCECSGSYSQHYQLIHQIPKHLGCPLGNYIPCNHMDGYKASFLSENLPSLSVCTYCPQWNIPCVVEVNFWFGHLPRSLMFLSVSLPDTMENSMGDPQKLKIELPYNPAIPLLGIYPKKMKTLTWKAIFTPCSLQHYVQQSRHENNLSVHWHMNG